MKVLHVSPSFHPADAYGGPVEAGYALCRALSRAGCTVRVLTTNANGRRVLPEVDGGRPALLKDDVTVRYCARQAPESVSLGLAGALPSAVRWADVVHLTAAYSFPTLPTLLACRVLARPAVWSPRGAFLRWRGSRRRLGKALWERACRLLAPVRTVLHATSDAEAAACAERMPGMRTVVVPNGVEVPDAVERAPGDGTLRLLYLGRLDPIKGLENLLAACRILDDTLGPAWTLTVAGAGERDYAARLERRRSELGLSRVRFVGHVTGAARESALASAGVLVLPSHSESFGIVAAEALAHGVPVIAGRGTPWRRLPEVGCGLWVDNDPASLAEAIRRIRDMPLGPMGERGRRWMRDEFGWDRLAARMTALYGELRAG